MIDGGGHRCRSCRAWLRRGRTSALCDPCSGAARGHLRCPVPDGFYETAVLRRALAGYDFGVVFRAVRVTASLSQEDLGLLVGLSQSRVSDVERGVHRLRDVAVVARVARALGIPSPMLGFGGSATGNVAVEEVSWVDRREFFTAVTAITLGVGGVLPELERLDALLPVHSDPPTPRRLGAADIVAIEETTAAFRIFDHRHGGGLSRAAAVAQLRYVLSLQDASCTDQVRADLLLATADLAMTAAWMTYDVEQHDAARRLWMIALDTARHAEHPRSTDLTVDLLLQMAHQALHLDRANEALRLVELGAAAAVHRSYPVSASTRSHLATHLAWCRAALGEAEPCQRALDEAHQLYEHADPAAAPPWAAHVTPAEIAAQHGHSMFLLSQIDPAHAPTALAHLRSAVDGYGDTYARSRAVNLPGLAGSHFHVGDFAAAVATGHHAVTEISTLSSKRAYARLRDLDAVAAQHEHHPDVAELRHRLDDVLSAAA